MSSDRVLRLLFFIYFTAAGTILVLAPWSAGWDHLLRPLPFAGIEWLQHPLARAAISGFGLMHLVWGFHDLLTLFLLAEHEAPRTPPAGDQ